MTTGVRFLLCHFGADTIRTLFAGLTYLCQMFKQVSAGIVENRTMLLWECTAYTHVFADLIIALPAISRKGLEISGVFRP